MVIQTIRRIAPSVLLKIYQRRLLDKNAEISQDEIFKVQEEFDKLLTELHEEMCLVVLRMERLNDCNAMFKRLIDKKDLM